MNLFDSFLNKKNWGKKLKNTRNEHQNIRKEKPIKP